MYAARAVLPQMLARGEGYLVQTASAAGLLSQVNAAPYSVTKHAAVGFAEWLSIAYGERGIRVSCLCPQGVMTPMLMGSEMTPRDRPSFLAEGAVTPEAVAAKVLEAMAAETFLDPAACRGADLLAAQDGRLRPLAARHAPPARQGHGDGGLTPSDVTRRRSIPGSASAPVLPAWRRNSGTGRGAMRPACRPPCAGCCGAPPPARCSCCSTR